MPIFNLIDTHDIESWDSAISDHSPGTVTDISIRADAKITCAAFSTSFDRIDQDITGIFNDPLQLDSLRCEKGQVFRVASVFTTNSGERYFALTDETSIFALGFLDAKVPVGKSLRLRTIDRKAMAGTQEREQNALICFTPGCLILCENGPRRASEIQPGDKVRTADRGLQEVRWRGETNLTAKDLADKPHLRPVLVRKNAIAAGIPARDIELSPRHHILIDSWRAELLFGEKEVLATAASMVNEDTISRSTSNVPVRYIHLKFIRHEILFANGLQAESFQPKTHSIAALSEPEREALFTSFPALRSDPGSANGPAARRLLSSAETKLLVERTAR